jgi:hypothetical protein
MTTGTANKLADERADSAVVAVLTPICGEIPPEQRCDSEPQNQMVFDESHLESYD